VEHQTLKRDRLVWAFFLPLKFVMDGFVGSFDAGELERTTRKDDGRVVVASVGKDGGSKDGRGKQEPNAYSPG
jgi:hypothetical protein